MELLILSVLAVYGITLIISETDAPFGVLYKLREKYDMLSCFICVSVWVSALVSLYTVSNFGEWLLHTFAFSGAAILLNRLSNDY